MSAKVSSPVYASYPSDKLTIGTGVAIFHLATARVVVCYHTRDKYWFLPKGRRNANEVTTRGAEREGFEESGYRNRVLPLPYKHRQPDPDEGHQRFVTEPIWTQLLPLTTTAQYMLFWYAAETVPKVVEDSYTDAQAGHDESRSAHRYNPPPPFPAGFTIKQRIAMDVVKNDGGRGEFYEPVWHEGTGVDEEELLYKSYLLPLDEAKKKLRNGIMQDLLQRIWDAVQLRIRLEEPA